MATEDIVKELGYQPFDADNHYYEAEDAFTRHLDPKYGERVIQWCQIGKRKYHVIGGKVSHAVTNPTFDPVSPAGLTGRLRFMTGRAATRGSRRCTTGRGTRRRRRSSPSG